MAQMTNDELMQYLRGTGQLQGQMYGNSFQTGANDGYVIDWSHAPGQDAAQQAAVADPTGPGGFGYTPPADWTPSINNATYVPDWAAATKKADNGGFMADYGWLPMLLAGVGAGSGILGGTSGLGGASADGMDLMYGSGAGSGAGSATAAVGSAAPAGWTQEAWDGLNGLQYSGAGTTAGAAGSGNMELSDWLSTYLQGNGAPDAVSAATGSGGTMDLSSLYPDFGNYSGQMSQIPGLESSLTQVPLDLSTNAVQSALASSPGLLEYIKSNPLQAANILKTVTGAGGSGSLLGTALGGLLGSINGAKQAGTTTTTQEPWAGQQPYLLDAFEKARQASNGTTPMQTQANSNYSSVLSGPTKNPMLGLDNPYLQQSIDNANADTTRAMMPAMNQANYASGSFGNSGVADQYGTALAKQYGINSTNARMTDYTNQQNLQQQAVNNTLGFTTNANNYAAQPSQNYAQTIQGNYGGSTTTPYYNNTASNVIGGALVGNKIGSNLGF